MKKPKAKSQKPKAKFILANRCQRQKNKGLESN
jgi:hypothetical protein